MPFVQKENYRLEQKLKHQAEEIRKRDERLAALEKREAERDQARGQIEESSLLSELATANENGDHRRVAQVQAELSKLYAKQNVSRETPPAAPTVSDQNQYVNTLMTNFVAANPVFADAAMQGLLTEELVVVKTANPQLAPEDLLARARDRVRRIYPEHFQTRRVPPMAETGGTPPPARSTGSRTWADLRPDVRDAMDAFIKGSEHHNTMPLDKARASILKQADDSYFRSK